VRIGLSLRALRMRRRWRQHDLAARAGVSRSLIARVERGGVDRLTLRRLEQIASSLGARVEIRVLWQGEALDRLLDARHASLVEAVIRLLRDAAWQVATEVSFNEWGERGSIDILAYHPATRSLLVIEVKSAVPDLQAMLVTLDRKGRIATVVARERGWSPATVSRILVVPNDRTSRRRIARHSATFAAALPARTVAIRRWVRAPGGALNGVLFVTDVTAANTRHRVSAAATGDHARDHAASDG
jgi:transcriptional regulator with XRE-family HTH domain